MVTRPRQLVLGESSSTENSLLFDSETMLLSSSVTNRPGVGGVDFIVVVVVVVVVVDDGGIVGLLVPFVVLLIDSLVGSLVTSLFTADSKLGDRVTTAASVLS